MKKDTPNFFDARTIIAIVLVAGTFMGWQYYMQKKYPQAFNKNKTTETAPVAANSAVKSGSEPIETKSPPVSADRLEDAAPTLTAESVVRFENANMAFDLSSKGMGIANVTLNKYKDREGKLIEIGHAEGELRPLQTRLRGQPQPLDFKVVPVPTLGVVVAARRNRSILKRSGSTEKCSSAARASARWKSRNPLKSIR